MNQFDVTIVIVNWNTRQLVCDCIKSILNETNDITYEVIVVDNGSTDNSVEEIKKNFPTVRVIANVINKGYAAACNMGITAGSGRYVLLLNSDILITDSAIGKTVHYADSKPQTGIIGCQVLNSDKTILKTCFCYPTKLDLFFWTFGLSKLFKNNRLFGRERMRWWNRDSEREVEVVTGMFIFTRRCAIEQVGLMDEDYFFYGEELDWCYRFHKAGWKLMFWPGARIIHVGGGGQSSQKIPIKAFVQQQKSMLLFFRKHRGLTGYIAARIMFVLLFLSRYFSKIFLLLQPNLTSEKRKFHKLEKMKMLAALKFCALSVEPEKPETRITSRICKNIITLIRSCMASVYFIYLNYISKKPRRVVLYYHDLNRSNSKQFEKHIKYLCENCRIINPSEIKTASMNGDKLLVSITFDDAYSGIFENAIPILKKYGVTAGISVPAGYLGTRAIWLNEGFAFNEDNSVMSAEQVKQLDEKGFEIMSHTVTHSRLTELDDENLKLELAGSKRILEELLGHEVRGICYPHGDNDERVFRNASKAGYSQGFTIEPELADKSVDDLQIGRFSVSPDENLLQFKLKVNGSFAITKYLKRLKKNLRELR